MPNRLDRRGRARGQQAARRCWSSSAATGPTRPSPAARPSRRSSAARPDIVFLDLMLPDINGYEVCQALKARKDDHA